MLLISSPSLGINLQRLCHSPRQPWLDFLPCLLRCKSGIHLARWLLDRCLNADLKILVETALVPSGCEGRITTFLSFPGDSCVAQSEHSSAGLLQLLCMNVTVSRRQIPFTKVVFPSLPCPGGAPGLQPEGAVTCCDPLGPCRCRWLLPHCGHPAWASPGSTVSLFYKSIAVIFSLFKQDVTGNSRWAQQRLSSVELRTQRWFHKSHLLSDSTMRHVCILRKAFCIQPIPHVFRGRF